MEEKKLNEILLSIATYARHISDWATIKKEILKSINTHDRKYFSTRDPLTKEQTMNEFEKEVAKKWTSITGVELIVNKRK